MANRIVFTKEQRKEIQLTFCKSKKLKDIASYKRVEALNMRRLGKTNKEISEITGFHPQYITDLVRLYCDKGMSAIVGNHYTSHCFRLTFEEETLFLEQFRETAEAGQITSVKLILAKFEEVTGKKSCTSTIYALLKRHGWRKVMPRPHHPKGATEEQMEASKKLTQFGKKSYWKNIS